MKNPELIRVERYDKGPSFLVEILLGALMVAVWLGVFLVGCEHMIELDTPSGVSALNKQDVKYILPPTSAQVYLGVGAVIETKDGALIEAYHTVDEIKDEMRCLK